MRLHYWINGHKLDPSSTFKTTSCAPMLHNSHKKDCQIASLSTKKVYPFWILLWHIQFDNRIVLQLLLLTLMLCQGLAPVSLVYKRAQLKLQPNNSFTGTWWPNIKYLAQVKKVLTKYIITSLKKFGFSIWLHTRHSNRELQWKCHHYSKAASVRSS